MAVDPGDPTFQRQRDEWEQVNREESRQDAAFVGALSIGERLELGQQLSDQAFELINSVRASGHATAVDPRT